uniref:Uncharacterized protein n=1 Tax=Picea glauca TaxID=3330 RepID=A0A101LZ75_PICGL|nr:hypothetical protein ABT39_MTgene4995 [Picea glauca]
MHIIFIALACSKQGLPPYFVNSEPTVKELLSLKELAYRRLEMLKGVRKSKNTFFYFSLD